ncbi:MAG: hypothetical protein WAK01_20425 [Methylocystis sp.]
MSAFGNQSLAVIFVESLVAFFLAVEAGYYLGSRTDEGKNVTTLEASVLGLLALMIGFTFSMALNRFEARRDALMSEANAIGTAALRARLLPPPYGEESLKLFRDYAHIRVDFGELEQTSQEVVQALRRSREIHEALWRQAQGAAAKDNALVPTGLYIQALNEAFDSQQKRLTIVANRVPRSVFVTLYVVAFGALWLAGFASASDKRRWRLPTYIPCLLVAGVILLIQDLDRPGGFITVGQQPMIDAAEALDGYASLPHVAPTSAPTVKSGR